jgi:hypothetical protein
MCISGVASNNAARMIGVGMDARMSCGAVEGAKERPVLLRTVVCDACWDGAVHFPDREPGQIDVELTVEQLRPGPASIREARAGPPVTNCGAVCPWHRFERGRWVLLEPDGYLYGLAGNRGHGLRLVRSNQERRGPVCTVRRRDRRAESQYAQAN